MRAFDICQPRAVGDGVVDPIYLCGSIASIRVFGTMPTSPATTSA
jgi:hypothetical protein